VFGEISLTGELRSCSQSERRVGEATRAGFAYVVAPAGDAGRRQDGDRVGGAADLRAAMAIAFDGEQDRPTDNAASDDRGV
jgi:DNA repair protein RadA/Sms